MVISWFCRTGAIGYVVTVGGGLAGEIFDGGYKGFFGVAVDGLEQIANCGA
jgi:hypothetical protein